MIRLDYNPENGIFHYEYNNEKPAHNWETLCDNLSLKNCEDFMKYLGKIPYGPGKFDTLEEMKLKLEDFLLNT